MEMTAILILQLVIQIISLKLLNSLYNNNNMLYNNNNICFIIIIMYVI